jgi:hypothetical protein
MLELPLSSNEGVSIVALTKEQSALFEKCVKCSCDKLLTFNVGAGLQNKCTRCSYVWAFGGDTSMLNMTQADRELQAKLGAINAEIFQQSYLEEQLDDIW